METLFENVYVSDKKMMRELFQSNELIMFSIASSPAS